ncbi:unnamed protein product [Effrenium voratum]|nr:unnamed protein product [Effrenium voratum]
MISSLRGLGVDFRSTVWIAQRACACVWLAIPSRLCYSCYHSFLANVSYVLEEGHGKGLPATCVVIAGVMAFMYVVTQVQSYFLDGSVMEVARCAMLCTLPAVLLDFVAAGLSVRSLWGYLVPTAIHVSLIAMPVMSLPTLYMQPLEKVAGLAASMEVVTAGVLSSVCSVLSTEALIYAGQAGIVLFQGAVTFSAVLIFWLGQGIWSRGQRCT